MNARSTVSRTNIQIQPRRGFKNRAAAKTVDRHHLSSYPLNAVCRAAGASSLLISVISSVHRLDHSSALAMACSPCCAIQ